ncbi:MAG: ATPase, T2SS/T4P/T4SS family [archaeon]
MHLNFDPNKCVKCEQCLKICPALKEHDKKYDILFCDNCGKCAEICPKNAIIKVHGIFKIDQEKCDNCGICVNVCPKKAIIKSPIRKCDLCLDLPEPLCIKSCTYGAISLGLNKEEKNFFDEVIGWEKRELLGEDIYKLELEEINFFEAKLISSVLKKFREKEFGEEEISRLIEEYCVLEKMIISEEKKRKIYRILKSEIFGLSVLDNFLKDLKIEEIAILGENEPVFVFLKGEGWKKTEVVFKTEEKLLNIANRIAKKLNRRLTLQTPCVSGFLPFARVQIVAKPVCEKISICIRKFNEKPFTPADLIKNGTISAEALAFLKMGMENDLNLMVCGNTGSGKTSFLNMLFTFVPKDERILIIEETPEIVVPHENLVRLVVQENVNMKMNELIDASLRMRPDRVIVGEIRNFEECRSFINTLLAGQGKSSYATFHAQNAFEALTRMKSFGIPLTDLVALDAIVTLKRWTKDGKIVRRVVEIASVKKDYEKIGLAQIFIYDPKKDKLVFKEKKCSAVSKILFQNCMDLEDLEKKIGAEARELEKMAF